MMATFDCIVVGLGGMGSAALRSAAEQGWKVLGIDRFGVAHDRGSSHGQTRIIRAAYYEHPDYVPLAQRAFSEWAEVQSRSEQELFRRTGLLQIGDPASEVIRGTEQSARAFGLAVERLDEKSLAERFPMLKISSGQVGLYEEQAGFLRVERCVATMAKLARDAGAEIKSGVAVERWQVEPDGTVRVFAGDSEYTTKRLILCAGAWSDSLLGDVCGALEVVRKQQLWFQLDRIDIKAENGFPAFLIETDDGIFYGFPEIDYLGMKVAEHSGGRFVREPSHIERLCNTDDQRRAERFLDENFVFGHRRLVHDSPCMYTLTKDRHFVVDVFPGAPQVVFAAGMSGHGFKFAPVVGQYLVDLLNGESDRLFDFLKVGERFAR